MARRRSSPSTGSSRRPATREGAAPADDRRAGARRRDGRRRDRTGLVVLLGVGPDDTDAIADDLARKAAELRIFRDDGRPDEPVAARRSAARRSSSRSSRCTPTRVVAAGRGSPARRRPGARRAALPAVRGGARGARRRRSRPARFGAEMAVELVNDGPFTIWLDTGGPLARAADTARMATLTQAGPAPPPRRRALGDEGRPVPDRAAVRDMGDRRHDPDERVRAAARARAVPVADRRARGDRGRTWRGAGESPLADRIEQARAEPAAGSKKKADEGRSSRASEAPPSRPLPTRPNRRRHSNRRSRLSRDAGSGTSSRPVESGPPR